MPDNDEFAEFDFDEEEFEMDDGKVGNKKHQQVTQVDLSPITILCLFFIHWLNLFNSLIKSHNPLIKGLKKSCSLVPLLSLLN